MKKFSSNILDDFYNSLVGIYSDGTSKCYVNSYVKPALERILNPYFEKEIGCTPFNSFNQSKNNNVQRSLIIAISESLLEKEINELALGKAAKTIKNWRSGLRAFFTFLENEDCYFDCKTPNSTFVTSLQRLKSTITYSKEDMSDIFLSRLITQDRAYSHMIYPARVLNQIFNNSAKRDDYRKILGNALEAVKFIVDDKGNTVQLNRITSLCIDYGKSGAVSICISGKQYELYTETPKKSGYEKIFVTDFGDLSLDHDTPLQNILDNSHAQNNYQKLYNVSYEYASFVNGTHVKDYFLTVNDIRNFKKYSPSCYNSKKTEFSKTDFVDSLFKDFCELYEKISFTIMLKSYNSSKGKGTTVTP